MGYFETVSPKQAGIRSEGIFAFLDAVKRSGLELHRMMILRKGKCCAKAVWLPYRETDHHPLYSFSKTVTATAIGFARQEGLLSLDEKIVNIFPEDMPECINEHLAACTIRDLLCMSCGQETEIWDRSENWRKTFFSIPFLHKPGTFYKYNTPGTNILASVIRKKTGVQVTEYLRSRLFDPLGMGEVFCSSLPDDLHTQEGGSGMKMTLEDMAKFILFISQDGCWEGKTLLKDWYFSRAGVKQIETAHDMEGHVKDWAYGYGYQCWMGSLPRSFRADGAFGQFGLVYPTLDLCVILNSATEQTQTLLDAVNQYLLPAVEPEGVPDKTDDREFLDLIFELPALISSRNPVFEAALEGKTYVKTDGKMSGIKRLIGGAGLKYIPDDGSIEAFSFSFKESSLDVTITENGKNKVITAANDGSFSYSVVDEICYAATARWRSLRKLEMEIRRMDAMSGVRLILKFDDRGKMLIEADETLMTDSGLGMTQRYLVPFVQKG